MKGRSKELGLERERDSSHEREDDMGCSVIDEWNVVEREDKRCESHANSPT